MAVFMFIVLVSFLSTTSGQGSHNQMRGNRDLSSSDVVKEDNSKVASTASDTNSPQQISSSSSVSSKDFRFQNPILPDCDKGSYYDGFFSISCTSCPKGTTTEGKGGKFYGVYPDPCILQCDAGSRLESQSAIPGNCLICEIGTYSSAGSASCTSCNDGYTTLKKGSTSSSDCDTGVGEGGAGYGSCCSGFHSNTGTATDGDWCCDSGFTNITGFTIDDVECVTTAQGSTPPACLAAAGLLTTEPSASPTNVPSKTPTNPGSDTGGVAKGGAGYGSCCLSTSTVTGTLGFFNLVAYCCDSILVIPKFTPIDEIKCPDGFTPPTCLVAAGMATYAPSSPPVAAPIEPSSIPFSVTVPIIGITMEEARSANFLNKYQNNLKSVITGGDKSVSILVEPTFELSNFKVIMDSNNITPISKLIMSYTLLCNLITSSDMLKNVLEGNKFSQRMINEYPLMKTEPATVEAANQENPPAPSKSPSQSPPVSPPTSSEGGSTSAASSTRIVPFGTAFIGLISLSMMMFR